MTANDQKTLQKISPGETDIPRELPVLPLENVVIYPFMVTPLQVSGEQSLQLIADVIEKERILALVAQKDPDVEDEFDPDNLYRLGTAASIIKMAKIPDGSAMILVQGVCRVEIQEFIQPRPYIKAHVRCLKDEPGRQKTVQALMSNLSVQFEKLVSLVPHLPDELKIAITNNTDPSRQADLVASNLRLTLEQRQDVLQTLNIQHRLEKVTKLLNTELEVLELGSKIQTQVESQMGKSQREYYLREQMKAIQNELGEEDEITREIRHLRQRLETLEMPAKALAATEREIERLSRMPAGAGEYTVSRTYVDWMLNLPWSEETDDSLDIQASGRILDEDHFDLEKVKERIIEYLAVRRLKKDMKGPILCFAGPPGVGKTSLGKSIARALGRKFVRISLGGIRDEAEIRGHRRTYVGSLPGRIIQALREAGSRNPVFMLDEVDKLGADFRGDPSSALLEVLDPEQNDTFSDHYLDVPFDLSQVMFIATANLLETIPPPLRDRMEVLEIPGYMREDKVKIAQKFIIPKQLEMHGIRSRNLKIGKPALTRIIEGYTRESGLRNLEREIASICRKAARRVAEGDKRPVRIIPDNLGDFLGPERFYAEVAERTSVPGVVTGLAWTMTGGEILFIESTRMKGGKGFTVTGQLGDVMKESARAALSWVRSKAADLSIDPDLFENHDIHVHIPAGAIPKDGPSAGVTIAASLVSLLTNRKIRSDVAMTGEITLRGKVLPVGGIKEKLLAAHRAKIKTVLLPNHNEKDALDLPEKVKQGLRLVFVENMEEVISVAFDRSPKHRKTPKKKAAAKKPTKKRTR